MVILCYTSISVQLTLISCKRTGIINAMKRKPFIGLLIILALLAGQTQVVAQVAFSLTYVRVVSKITDLPTASHWATVADVNEDGKLDLVSANWYDNTLSVFTNNGNGVFGSNAIYTVGYGPRCIVAADINGDGKLDLICADQGDNALVVLTNNGTGGFHLASSIATGAGTLPATVTAADVNGDGKVDLISANYGNNTLSVFTNNRVGVFSLKATYAVGGNPRSVIAADVNGDGKVDLICVNVSSNTLSVLTNNGVGGFGSNATYNVGSNPISVGAADLNGDGKVDLFCSNQGDNTLLVLTNNGHGIFGSNATYAVGNAPSAVIAADVNGDGTMDLICANYNTSGTLSVLTNNGNGHFTLASSPIVGSLPLSLAAADINGDGKVDLITANFGDNTLSVLINIPTLIITRSGNTVTVLWSSSWTNWTLMQNSNLTTTNWTASGGIFNNGINKGTTISSPIGNLFFRLFHP